MFGRSLLHKLERWYSEKVWNPVQVSGRRHFTQIKYQKLAEPTILCEMTDGKIKEKKEER